MILLLRVFFTLDANCVQRVLHALSAVFGWPRHNHWKYQFSLDALLYQVYKMYPFLSWFKNPMIKRSFISTFSAHFHKFLSFLHYLEKETHLLNTVCRETINEYLLTIQLFNFCITNHSWSCNCRNFSGVLCVL